MPFLTFLAATVLWLPNDSTHFPVVEGKNLEGRTFRLPDDFEGDLNVVVVAFKREQQRDVDTWMTALNDLAARHTGVRVYELPTIGKQWTLLRGWIDGGMRRGIPSQAVREATITLYVDKDHFKRPLGIKSEDQIQLFLVDRGGRIHWQASGTHTDVALAGLTAYLERPIK